MKSEHMLYWHFALTLLHYIAAAADLSECSDLAACRPNGVAKKVDDAFSLLQISSDSTRRSGESPGRDETEGIALKKPKWLELKEAKRQARLEMLNEEKEVKKQKYAQMEAQKKAKMMAYVKEKEEKNKEAMREYGSKKNGEMHEEEEVEESKVTAREKMEAQKEAAKKVMMESAAKKTEEAAKIAEQKEERRVAEIEKIKKDKEDRFKKEMQDKKDKQRQEFLDSIKDPTQIKTPILDDILTTLYNKEGKDACPKCTNHDSLITLNEGFMPCGLLDRMTNIRIWSQVAASVCARLELPKPCVMLSKKLVGHEVSPNKTWDDYVDVRLRSDNSSMIVQAGAAHKKRVVIQEDPGDIEEAFLLDGPKARLKHLDSEGKNKRAQGRQVLRENYALAKQKVHQGKAFHWNLHGDWINFDFMSLMDIAGNCDLVEMHPTSAVKQAAEQFLQAARIKKGQFLTLHVRRGDSKAVCDTSTKNVGMYVQRTLRKEGWLNSTHEPLVIFTDEKSPKYKRLLLKQFAKRLGERMVLLGDPMIKKISQTKDNGFVFQTSLHLRRLAKAELFMDRSQCKSRGICKAPCRGESWDEYVVQSTLRATQQSAEECNKVLMQNPPEPSCPAEYLKEYPAFTGA